MYPIRFHLALLTGLFAVVCHAQDAPPTTSKPKPGRVLTAREVFYVAMDSDQSGSPSKPAPKPKVVVKKKPKPAPGSAAVTAADPTPDPIPPVQVTPVRAQSGEQTPRSADGTPILKASSTTYPALGLKYSVFQYASGKRLPVDPDQTFHSNEHIQLTMEVSSPGYLYVVSRGASGKWSTLFPDSEAEPEANHLTPGRTYRMPPGETSVITFYEPAGKEQLFLFLSRQPIHSSEDLMMQMSGEKGVKATSTPARAAEPVMEAMNRLGDSDINRLTKVYARDLIIEKASSSDPEKTSAVEPDPKAVSMYVVNPSGNPDSHVVANITLKHE